MSVNFKFFKLSVVKHCSVRIIGKVQGVAFRYYAKLRADELGLFGTTENQKDGSVFIFVGGDNEKVDLFLEWCHRGSPASEVEAVIITELSSIESGVYKDFSILR